MLSADFTVEKASLRTHAGAPAPGAEPVQARRGEKRRRIGNAAVLAAALGFALAPIGTAQAQDYVQGWGYRYHSERAIPNVPDARGCVMLCEFDLNPCDPPIYKREDGRCTPMR